MAITIGVVSQKPIAINQGVYFLCSDQFFSANLVPKPKPLNI